MNGFDHKATSLYSAMGGSHGMWGVLAALWASVRSDCFVSSDTVTAAFVFPHSFYNIYINPFHLLVAVSTQH